MKFHQTEPDVFEIDTNVAEPVDKHDVPELMQQLWSLQASLTAHARQEFETVNRLEESEQTLKKEIRGIRKTVASIADELRNVMAAAEKVLAVDGDTTSVGSPPSDSETQSRGWLGRWFSGSHAKPPPPVMPPEWFDAFVRLWRLFCSRLEQAEIHYVPLLGRDLRDVTFDGQGVHRWVSVKNKPKNDQLIVNTEIQGLWIYRDGKRLEPIQRGEVTV